MYGLLAKRVYRIAFELRVSEYQNRQSIKHSIALDNYINIDIVDTHTYIIYTITVTITITITIRIRYEYGS